MQDIFETLTDTGTDYDTAKKKLDDYFSPKKNVDFNFVKLYNCLVKVLSSLPPDYVRWLSIVSSMMLINKSSQQSYRTVAQNV